MLHIVFVLLLSDVLAHYLPEPATPNVGSVLFTVDDVDKKRWSRSKIELLRIRKFLQNVIPPPRVVDTVNEEYITYLLTYFQNAYTTIKREIKSPSLQELMEIALSDALGGYLKIWILPVTKYAYYGGSASLHNALKVLQLYGTIKTKLNTDGQNWRNPNDNLLNYVAINIAFPEHVYIRSISNPCNDFAYYEKTEKGLAIPLPRIDWNMSPSAMFLPLKNQSIVALNSINSSQCLLRYYDVAKTCIQSQNPENMFDFDNGFQVWLINDVIPHLNDSDFYVAFGGILSLLNKTKNYENHFINTCDSKPNLFKKILNGIPAHLTTKKFFILGLILLFEIIWCIPTLLCIIFSKKKEKNAPKHCFSWFRRKYCKESKYCNFASDFYKKEEKERSIDRLIGIDIEPQLTHDLKLFFKPHVQNSEARISSYNIKNRLSRIENRDNELVLDENSGKRENSIKNVASKILQVSNSNTKPIEDRITLDIEQETNGIDNRYSEKCTTTEKVRSITTLKKESEITVKQITYSQVDAKSSVINASHISKVNQKFEKFEVGCPCEPCKSVVEKKDKNIVLKKENVKKIKRKTNTKEKYISQPSMKKLPTVTYATTKPNEKVKDSKPTISNTENPLLRIKIESPKAEIQLGIRTYKEHSNAPIKPSKIPRLSIVTSHKDKKDKPNPLPVTANQPMQRNIPETKTRCLDDGNLLIRNIQTDNKKLNISL